MLDPSARGDASTAASPADLSARALASTTTPLAGPWRYALSADRRWALVCDAEGRNLAEVHRPALSTGPYGRPLTFEQVVRVMSLAPMLVGLLEAVVACDVVGGEGLPSIDGIRERAIAALRACR